jgi:hypothetical protein
MGELLYSVPLVVGHVGLGRFRVVPGLAAPHPNANRGLRLPDDRAESIW